MEKINGANGKNFINVSAELLGGLGVAIALLLNLRGESKRNKAILENLNTIEN
jgi:hypothetical protein